MLLNTMLGMKKGTAIEVSKEDADLAEIHIIEGGLREYSVAKHLVFGEAIYVLYRSKAKIAGSKKYGRPKVYDWPSLEIGQSKKFEDAEKFNSIRAGISRYAKKSGRKFQTKQHNGKLWIRRLS